MPNCWEVIFLVFMDIKDWPQMQRKLSGKRFRDFRELSTCHVHHRHRSAGSGPPANLSTNDSSKMSNDHTRIVTTSTRAQWKIFCPASSPFLKLNIDSRTKVIESHHEMFLFVPKTGDKDLQKFFCTFLNNKILVDFSLYSRQTGGSVTPTEVKSKCQVRLSWRSHVPHILSRAWEIGRACHVPFSVKIAFMRFEGENKREETTHRCSSKEIHPAWNWYYFFWYLSWIIPGCFWQPDESKGTFQKRFSGFFPLRGGGTPPFR